MPSNMEMAAVTMVSPYTFITGHTLKLEITTKKKKYHKVSGDLALDIQTAALRN